MSARSIGYTAIALPDGTYTSATIGVNNRGQVISLASNVITPEAEGLVEDYDALVAIVDDSVAKQKQTQETLKSLNDTIIPNLTTTQSTLTAAVKDLQSQYDTLETEYQALNSRFTPVLALAYTAEELDIPDFPCSSYTNVSVKTFTLPPGKYTWFFNAYGTMRYLPVQVGNPPIFTSVSTPSNPLDASLQPDVQGLDGSDYWYNFASQSCSLLANGIIASVIANFDTTDIGTADSGLGLNSKIDNATVWAGSNTFVLTEETNNMELKVYMSNINTINGYLGYNQDSLVKINQAEENTVFNMPVLQVGNTLEIWKVGN